MALYPFTSDVLARISRLLTYYNQGAYDASTNPGGFTNDGHEVNFHPSLQDVATVAQAVGDAANAASTSAGVLASAGAVTGAQFDAVTGHLVFTLSTGGTIDAGNIPSGVISPYLIDLTNPAAATVTRTGATMVKIGTSTAVIKGDNTNLIEDMDGFIGQWTNAAITNLTPSWNFVSGWTSYNGGTGTPNVATAPDGTVTAAKLTDSSTSLVQAVYAGTGTSGSIGHYRAVWVKPDTTNPPTAPGMLSSDHLNISATPFPANGSPWTYMEQSLYDNSIVNTSSVFAFYPAGIAPGPVNTVSATGAMQVWGAFAVASTAATPKAQTTLTAAGLVLPASAALAMISDGTLDITWEFLPSWLWGGSGGIPVGTAWSAANGAHSLRMDGTGQFILRINNIDRITAVIPDTGVPGEALFSARGQLVRVRAWWDTIRGEAGIRVSAGGAVGVDKTVTPSGGTLESPLNFFVGSDNNISGFLTVRHRKIIARRSAARTFTPRIIAMGDSTISGYAGYASVPSWVLQGGNQSNDIFQGIAVPGHTIAQQKTKWQALTSAMRQNAQGVVIQIGLNDTDPTEAASVAIARIQDLVNTVRADNATAKIIISKMLPCKARFIALYGSTAGATAQTKWTDMNNAIAGAGPTPITGVDARVTSHVPLLDDGAGNLATAYQSYLNDGLHPNNPGRNIIATAWRTTLIAQGLVT